MTSMWPNCVLNYEKIGTKLKASSQNLFGSFGRLNSIKKINGTDSPTVVCQTKKKVDANDLHLDARVTALDLKSKVPVSWHVLNIEPTCVAIVTKKIFWHLKRQAVEAT